MSLVNRSSDAAPPHAQLAATAAVQAPTSSSDSRSSNYGTDFRTVRVTKGFGSRGYDSIRVSVVTDSNGESAGTSGEAAASTAVASTIAAVSWIASYSADFVWRWTQLHLRSGLVNMTSWDPEDDAVTRTIDLGDGESIEVSLPKQGAGVRGVLIADPCTESTFVRCTYGKVFETKERTPRLLEALVGDARNGISYWGILGDSLYDQSGNITTQFFDSLSKTVTQKITLMTPGNHDYWVGGSPSSGTDADQYGNGFAQFYAMDPKAAEEGDEGAFLDLSVDPDASADDEEDRLAAMENFQWYNQIGNAAFIGFSGAYSYSKQESFFEEACSWLGDNAATIDVAMLVAHWNTPDDGCGDDADVPSTHMLLGEVAGCSEFKEKGRLLWFSGHTHCASESLSGDNGFLVAGQGMSGCGQYAFPVVDTTGGRLQIYSFAIASQPPEDTSDLRHTRYAAGLAALEGEDVGFELVYDRYEEVYACLQSHGMDGCMEYADVWYNESLSGT